MKRVCNPKGCMDKPVTILQPAPGTIIENLNLDGDFGAVQYGIYINCYPSAKNPNYVCKGLVIRNNNLTGFKQNIVLIGPQLGTQIYGNRSVLSTGTWDTMQKGGHSHGLYTEGFQQGCQVHDNFVYDNGWWPTYDPTDIQQRTLANLNHGWYGNEGGNMDDTTLFYNNIFIDNVGSNVACRKGGKFWNNVFRGVGDQDLIIGPLGKGANIFNNAHFGPRVDAVPYYGGGIHAQSLMLCVNNMFSGNAKITNNPTAIDVANNIVPQLGYWPKPGATVATKQPPTLEDFCIQKYGKPDVTLLQTGDAKDIVPWLAFQLVTNSY